MMHDIINIIKGFALPVDTFLMIGGVLITYTYFKRKQNDGKFNIIRYYLHRYIRLTPSLAGVILLNSSFIRYIGFGPHWKGVEEEQLKCDKYWWSALLYIQNYYNEEEMCLPESWYLDVDMQLYLFSPLIIYLLKRKPKSAITSIGCICLISIASSFWILYDRRIIEDPLSMESQHYYDKKYYIKTHTRAVPWLMGIVLGYLLAGDKTISEKKYNILPTIAWILCGVVMLICICGQPILDRSRNIGIIFFLSLWIFVRPVWCLCLWWIIWACATNQGGIIKTILTNSIFQFLNQFTYSIYVLHCTVLVVIVFSQKTAFHFTIFNLIYSFFGIYMITVGLSVIWVLSFEKPVLILEKKIFKQE